MRALHFCFLMHHPYELHSADKWERGYYGGEESFQKVNEEEYQPFLALLERNAQRYPKLRISLAISGVWLEQAERWDAELIQRVKKLVRNGNVELVVVPYYYSAAVFFEMEELAAQVKKMREKLRDVFGVESNALTMPECCYHNKIARWAEKNDFRVVLSGEARSALAWREANRVYLAKGCNELRVLFQNAKISNYLVKASPETVTETEKAGDAKKVFSAQVFQKQLDLEFLRGDLINIYLSTKIFARWREEGIVGFFDEVFRMWMEISGRTLVGVKECEKMLATAEVAVRKTASCLGEAKKDYALPDNWQNLEIDRERRLYELREKILDTHDKDLYVDFARLTARDYAKGGAEFDAIFEDLWQKSMKFSRDRMADTQPAKKGMTASTKVKINFDHKAREARKHREQLLQLFREVNVGDELDKTHWDEIEMDDMEAAIQVMAQRLKQDSDSQHVYDYDDLTEAEVVTDEVWMEDGAADGEMEGFVDDEATVDELERDLENEANDKAKKKRKKIVIG